METYVIVRRSGWRTSGELEEAMVGAEEACTPSDVLWVRTYVLAELDGSLGTVCVYRASNPEAIRRHAAVAELPVDEIVAVADTIVLRPDPRAVPASGVVSHSTIREGASNALPGAK